MRLSQRVQRLAPSATVSIATKVRELEAQGVDVIGLSLGEPDFDTPDHIKEAATKAMRDGYTKYSHPQGFPKLREAVSGYVERRTGIARGSERVFVGSGAKHVLYILFEALLDEGDEVVIPAPYWVTYPEQVKLAGGVPVIVPTTEEQGFFLLPEALERAVTPRTKALILNTPSNPTGSAYPRGLMAEIVKICEKHGVLVVSDEVYGELVYEGSHASALPEAANPDSVFLVDAVSKTYAMTGWRVGWGVGAKEIISAMARLQGQETTHPCLIAQVASVAALSGPQETVAKMRGEFRKRRDMVVSRLSGMDGVFCRMPEGAFYAFPDVGKLFGRGVEDSLSLVEYLLEEAHVGLVPGSAFGAEGFFRLSYAAAYDRLVEALDRIERALGRLG